MNPSHRSPSGPIVTLVSFNHRVERPLLVLGPALGTSVRPLWEEVAAHLDADYHVVGWDLPGHGTNNYPVPEQFTINELTAALLAALSPVFADRNAGGGHLHYAGCGIGGVVGLQLGLDIRERVDALVVAGMGAVGTAASHWVERAGLTSTSDLAALTDQLLTGVVAPQLLTDRQATAAALVRAFTEIDPPGLSAAGYALRSFDLRAELPRMIPPVLVVTGSEDRIAPVRTAHELANDVPRGAVMTLEGVGHLAPAEDPSALAHLIREHTTPEGAPAPTTDHDREWERLLSAGAVTFESLASRQSPYELVQRPGLDEATRHALIICALATAGRLQELADHVRSAQRAGVGVGAIGEVLLLVAAYGGMPVARSAADVVARTLYGTRR